MKYACAVEGCAKTSDTEHPIGWAHLSLPINPNRVSPPHATHKVFFICPEHVTERGSGGLIDALEEVLNPSPLKRALDEAMR